MGRYIRNVFIIIIVLLYKDFIVLRFHIQLVFCTIIQDLLDATLQRGQDVLAANLRRKQRPDNDGVLHPTHRRKSKRGQVSFVASIVGIARAGFSASCATSRLTMIVPKGEVGYYICYNCESESE